MSSPCLWSSSSSSSSLSPSSLSSCSSPKPSLWLSARSASCPSLKKTALRLENQVEVSFQLWSVFWSHHIHWFEDWPSSHRVTPFVGSWSAVTFEKTSCVSGRVGASLRGTHRLGFGQVIPSLVISCHIQPVDASKRLEFWEPRGESHSKSKQKMLTKKIQTCQPHAKASSAYGSGFDISICGQCRPKVDAMFRFLTFLCILDVQKWSQLWYKPSDSLMRSIDLFAASSSCRGRCPSLFTCAVHSKKSPAMKPTGRRWYPITSRN